MTVLSVNLNKVALLRNSRGGALPSVDAGRARGAGGRRRRHHRCTRGRTSATRGRRTSAASRPGCRSSSTSRAIRGPVRTAAGYPGFLALVERRAARAMHAGARRRRPAHQRPWLRLRARRRAAASGGGATQVLGLPGEPVLRRRRAATRARGRARRRPHRDLHRPLRARACAAGDAGAALAACVRTAERAQRAGLGVNAGHDLDQQNLGPFLRAVPGVLEVSIGHALISEALYDGLAPTVQRYLAVIAARAEFRARCRRPAHAWRASTRPAHRAQSARTAQRRGTAR